MKVTIYTKDNCAFCDRAKVLLEMYKQEYTELKLDTNFNREELLELFPEARSFPVVTLDGEYIGGYNELARKLTITEE